MRARLAAALTTAALILAGCGSGSTPTPQERADALAAEFYAEHPEALDALYALKGETVPDPVVFRTEKACSTINDRLTEDEVASLTFYMGPVLERTGSDVGTFLSDLYRYLDTVEATGVCDR